MQLTGNKGEWSELYAFLNILSTGKLYSADESTNLTDNVFLPVLKIIRDFEDEIKEYIINQDDGTVQICSGTNSHVLPQSTLSEMATFLYDNIIVNGKKSSFKIDGADKIMDMLSCTKISAGSDRKIDTTIQLHDIRTGFSPICGFSIKSEVGSSPSLLNASKATNFVFEVVGLNEDQAKVVNAIDTPNMIIDRVKKIHEYGSLRYCYLPNSNFLGNLMLIDTYMDDIIASLLYDYYLNNISDCKTLITRLEDKNPLGYPRRGLYGYKFRKFLCTIALGMKPSKPWSGHDEATGGYIIVKKNGDVVAYHMYNRDAFETYLINNTHLERASTTRHNYATIYKKDDKMYFNLNLQVRFI